MKRINCAKIELTKESRSEIQAYLLSNSGKMPSSVENLIMTAMKGEQKCADATATLSLKLEMKLVPSSEKCEFQEGKKNTRKKRTNQEQQEHHRNMANMHRRKERAAAKRQRIQDEKRKAEEAKLAKQAPPPEPEPALEEEDSEDGIAGESNDFIDAQTQAGAHTDQDEYEPANFSIYGVESSAENTASAVLVSVTPEEQRMLGTGTFSSTFDYRERIDLVIDCRWIRMGIETLTNNSTGERVTASTKDFGPEDTQLTWQAYVNVIIATLGYAIPMRRLEKMLGEQFSAVTMVNIIDNFARKFLPIYIHLCNSLANAEILSVDDTPTRVNEVTSWKKALKFYTEKMKTWVGAKDEQPHPPPPKPWEERIRLRKEKWEQKNQERHKKGLPPLPQPPPSIWETVKQYFKFEFDRKSGEGTKISLNTTVVHGRTDPKKPRSRVVIYRTHFGCAGNFLETILQDRVPSNKELIIHGDMSSANNIQDPQLLKLFKFIYAGCLAHARRAFFRYRTHDLILTDAMLSGFAVISNVENLIQSDIGRNTLNTNLSRQNLAKPYWESIMRCAQGHLQTWSKLTPLGQAIRYLINNYENLTYYLYNPKLEPTNNDSENLLRWEALADASSFGCDTIEGRMRSDIVRSALATCGFARVDARQYILFILMADKNAMDTHPEYYTPQRFTSWSELKQEPSETSEKLALVAAQKALRIHHMQFETRNNSINSN